MICVGMWRGIALLSVSLVYLVLWIGSDCDCGGENPMAGLLWHALGEAEMDGRVVHRLMQGNYGN